MSAEARPATPDGPLRVALLAYRGKPHVGGQGIYVRHLAKALVDQGHSVEVFAGQPYPVVDERIPLHQLRSLDIYNDHYPMRMPGIWELKDWKDVVEVASFMGGSFPEPLAFSLRAWDALRQRTGDFDLVHDNQTLGYGLLGIQRDLPLLSTIHHPITVDRRLELEHAPNAYKRFTLRRWYAFTRMQTRVAKRMQRVLTVSENSMADIHRDHGVPLERMHVVPVGVDPELFTPLPHVARVPGRLVTTASADVTMKGLSFLLEALAKLRTERDDIHLTVIGRKKEGGASARKIDELGLGGCVEFITGVPDQRIVELYAEAQLAVVPSLYEGFSLPAIEAMSCGVPLVATTGGALPEVVGADNDTALLVPPGDAGALATRIAGALDDDALRARIGAAGRQRVIDQWSWKVTATRTVAEYRALLADRPAFEAAAKAR
jgi:glycosyltransferase involved in cell wall biosynthesis